MHGKVGGHRNELSGKSCKSHVLIVNANVACMLLRVYSCTDAILVTFPVSAMDIREKLMSHEFTFLVDH